MDYKKLVESLNYIKEICGEMGGCENCPIYDVCADDCGLRSNACPSEWSIKKDLVVRLFN